MANKPLVFYLFKTLHIHYRHIKDVHVKLWCWKNITSKMTEFSSHNIPFCLSVHCVLVSERGYLISTAYWYFLFFFLENRIWHFILRRQFAWSVESYYLGKIRKNVLKCRHLKILPSMQSVFIFFLKLNINRMPAYSPHPTNTSYNHSYR